MNKQIYLGVFILLHLSCFTPKEDMKYNSQKDQTEFSVKTFAGGIVDFESTGTRELGVPEGEILISFNNFSSRIGLGLNAQSVKMEEINGKHYLKFLNDNGTVSTIGLIKENQNPETSHKSIFRMGETICTSTPSTTDKNCVPEGLYCVSSEVNDCLRTTISKAIVDAGK